MQKKSKQSLAKGRVECYNVGKDAVCREYKESNYED